MWDGGGWKAEECGSPATFAYSNPTDSSLLPLSRANVGGRKVLVKRCRGESRFSVSLRKDREKREDPLMRVMDMKPCLEKLGVYEEWMGRYEE